MRVLCSTTAGDGHFGPLQVLARACLAAGHEVRVAAPDSYAGAVGRAGFEHVPFADAPAELIGPLFARISGLGFEQANATVMGTVFGRLDAQHAFPALQAAVADWRPDVILREPAEFGSLAAAEAAGIPHAEVAIGLAAMMRWARGHLVEPLRELDAIAGLHRGRLLTAMSKAPVFTIVPPSLDGGGAPARDGRRVVRHRAGAGTGAGRLPAAWGNPEHPLVYVTFGTVAAGMADLADLYRSALAALAGLPVRVLLTTGRGGGAGTAGPVPANAHVEEYWPQAEVMPEAALVVSHGGFGTTMTALAAGVPQLLLPLFSTDQDLNARGIAGIGAGLHVAGGPSAVERLRSQVPRALDDAALRRRCTEVAAEIASLPAPAEVVTEIERIAGRAQG